MEIATIHITLLITYTTTAVEDFMKGVQQKIARRVDSIISMVIMQKAIDSQCLHEEKGIVMIIVKHR